MKKKIYLFNPQLNSLIGQTLQDFFSGKKKISKYNYLIKLINQKKIHLFVNTDPNLIFLKKYKIFRIYKIIYKYFLKFIEIYLWMFINNINIFTTKIVFNEKKINNSDIVFTFSNIILDQKDRNLKRIKVFKSLSCKKIVHLSHFQFNTKTINENLQSDENIYFASESVLEKNNYFKKNFPNFNTKYLKLDFNIRENFKTKKNFKERINKCVALGTVQLLNDNDIQSDIYKSFYDFYKFKCIHKFRPKIFENSEKYNEFIDSKISITEEVKNIKDLRKYNNRDYYKLDMLQIYNSYKMFFPDEEQGEIPAVAFAEGIMCGSVLIGAKLPCYEILGMKDGVHYVAHDGSIENILEKIEFYQKNNEKLEIISNNARNLLHECFTFKKVTGKLLDFCNNL